MLSPNLSLSREWLEADGLGGFASGTSSGIRTRRYHAWLLTARTPPTGRMVLVNGVDAWIVEKREQDELGGSGGETQFLTSQRYSPGAVTANAATIESFHNDHWPT